MPTVSSYPDATTPLTGAETFYAVQGGNSRKVTLAQQFSTTAGAPFFACRAWVNFIGDFGGVPTIRAAGNVASITDLGVGRYRVNFTTAMPDSNYAVFVSSNENLGVSAPVSYVFSPLTTSFSIDVRNQTDSVNFDPTAIYATVFR